MTYMIEPIPIVYVYQEPGQYMECWQLETPSTIFFRPVLSNSTEMIAAVIVGEKRAELARKFTQSDPLSSLFGKPEEVDVDESREVLIDKLAIMHQDLVNDYEKAVPNIPTADGISSFLNLRYEARRFQAALRKVIPDMPALLSSELDGHIIASLMGEDHDLISCRDFPESSYLNAKEQDGIIAEIKWVLPNITVYAAPPMRAGQYNIFDEIMAATSHCPQNISAKALDPLTEKMKQYRKLFMCFGEEVFAVEPSKYFFESKGKIQASRMYAFGDDMLNQDTFFEDIEKWRSTVLPPVLDALKQGVPIEDITA